MRRSVLTAVVAACLALVASPSALAQAPPQPPAQAGCDVVFVSVGPVEASLLGTLTVNTPGTSLQVSLGGLAGSLVCGVIGGGGGVPAPPAVR